VAPIKTNGGNVVAEVEKNGNMKDVEPKKRATWQEVQERKISMVKERGSRVMLIISPIGSIYCNLLQQIDKAYAKFKITLGESGGVPYEEGIKIMEEGMRLAVDLDKFNLKLNKLVGFKGFTPFEMIEFKKDQRERGKSSSRQKKPTKMIEARQGEVIEVEHEVVVEPAGLLSPLKPV